MKSFAFFGSPPFAATVLKKLALESWQPAVVITEPAKPVGRGGTITPTAVATAAEQLGLPILTPTDSNELTPVLRAYPVDLFLVVAYGKIFPAELLDLPHYGTVNIHASLLPAYRGASPIQAAILNGDTHTGITYMLMERALDAGPILETVPVVIQPSDTLPVLSERLANTAASTVVPLVERYLSGAITPLPQNEKQATYARKITKQDGNVSLKTISPSQLDRMVRAYTPWPSVYTLEFGKRLRILSGKLQNGIYVITKLQWEGKAATDAKTFASAYPDILTKLPKTVTLGASLTKE